MFILISIHPGINRCSNFRTYLMGDSCKNNGFHYIQDWANCLFGYFLVNLALEGLEVLREGHTNTGSSEMESSSLSVQSLSLMSLQCKSAAKVGHSMSCWHSGRPRSQLREILQASWRTDSMRAGSQSSSMHWRFRVTEISATREHRNINTWTNGINMRQCPNQVIGLWLKAL